MRRTLLLFALLSTCFIAEAQFSKGQKLLGGVISYGTSKTDAVSPTDNSSNTNFYIAPGFSWFSSSTVMDGISIGYGNSTSNYNPSTPGFINKNTQDILTLSYTRTKLNKISNRFYFTYAGSLSGSYGMAKGYYLGYTPVYTSSLWSGAVSGNLGLLFQANKRFILTCALNNVLGINYQHSRSGVSVTGYSTSNSFSFSTGLSNASLNLLSIGAMLMLK